MTAEIADLDPPVDDEASKRRAAREYMRDYRSRPGPRSRSRWWTRTRNAALERLAAEYPERFGELLAEVRRAAEDSRPA